MLTKILFTVLVVVGVIGAARFRARQIQARPAPAAEAVPAAARWLPRVFGITVAALIVPSLEKIGVSPIAAHMFAFYFGVVSTITPPVALASFAGAAIARTPPMATAVESTRIGIAKYLVPFVFIYNPALLFDGPGWRIALSAVLTLAGLWVLSVALEGWLNGRVGPVLRAVLFIAAGAFHQVQPTGGGRVFLGKRARARQQADA